MSSGLLACFALGLTQLAHAGPVGYGGAQYHYPRAGYQVHSLPAQRHIIVAPGGSRYFYSRGVWYAPRGPNFVVV
ncbi:MAG TPA: hypothetical protein VNR40_08875, partial [Steroidobacter sp.]|nr:hypothetical protein [Steroidobacter sp.]